jgi:hypothetical protein
MREKFIYNLSGYGMTSDIYSLPIGTKFCVRNGVWYAEIVESKGIKYMYILDSKRMIELTPDRDYKLAIDIC